LTKPLLTDEKVKRERVELGPSTGLELARYTPAEQ
jgi:hypothetical protein